MVVAMHSPALEKEGRTESNWSLFLHFYLHLLLLGEGQAASTKHITISMAFLGACRGYLHCHLHALASLSLSQASPPGGGFCTCLSNLIPSRGKGKGKGKGEELTASSSQPHRLTASLRQCSAGKMHALPMAGHSFTLLQILFCPLYPPTHTRQSPPPPAAPLSCIGTGEYSYPWEAPGACAHAFSVTWLSHAMCLYLRRGKSGDQGEKEKGPLTQQKEEGGGSGKHVYVYN